MGKFKTIKEVAEQFGVTTQAVRFWVKKKDVAFKTEKVIGTKPRIVVDVNQIQEKVLGIKKYNKTAEDVMLKLDKALDDFVMFYLNNDHSLSFAAEQVDVIVWSYFNNNWGYEYTQPKEENNE